MTISNARTTSVVTAAIIDGGFDPVPVEAIAGDTVDVEVQRIDNPEPVRFLQAIAARRRPVVVRTDPPPKKRDVPLNAAIVIVFSEPVAGTTLTSSSVRLVHRSTVVAGTVHLLEGSTTAAVFVPDAPLDSGADYHLDVTQDVRDLDGDALETSAAVDFTTGSDFARSVGSVLVLPDTAAVAVGSQVQLTAIAFEVGDDTMPKRPVAGVPITWSSEDPNVATVCPSGLVTARGEGDAHIRADVDQGMGIVTGSAIVRVSATLTPVDSVELVPDSATIAASGRIELTAVLRDSAGHTLSFRSVSWTSNDSAIATVAAATGSRAWATGLSPGTAILTASSEGKSATASIRVVTPGPYSLLSLGGGGSADMTCGVTVDAWVFCWGSNYAGQLGNGTSLSSLLPSAVANGWKFSQVSPGTVYLYGSCALTSVGVAYCWGDNETGELGIGNSTGPQPCLYGPCSLTPVAVSTTLRFTTIGSGGGYACALTSSGAAYCWGGNTYGQLGIGTTTGPETCNSPSSGPTPCTTIPVAVAGGLTFTDLSVGTDHACALTSNGAAYCWGGNFSGQLGDSTTTDRASPVPVAGRLTFVALSTWEVHTCGLTSDGSAFCWGDNSAGQLGDGTNASSNVPVRVVGGLHWASISAGADHTCAVTPIGTAYCWGYNGSGALGDGTTIYRSSPVPVTGGLTFGSVTAGGEHTCGVTVDGIAYCWGNNQSGALGNGTTTQDAVPAPVKVAGQP